MIALKSLYVHGKKYDKGAEVKVLKNVLSQEAMEQLIARKLVGEAKKKSKAKE